MIKTPENSCPICGELLRGLGHHCRKTVLSAIDAANTRALNQEENLGEAPTARNPLEVEERFYVRLSQGFRMMRNEDYSSEDIDYNPEPE